MIRFIAASVVATIGFNVSPPVWAQADAGAPALFIAPDGTVTVNPGSIVVPPGTVVVAPPAGSGGVVWGTGSPSGLSWGDGWGLWGSGPGSSQSERPTASKIFGEASATNANSQSGTSAAVASPNANTNANTFAPCLNCSVAQLANGEQKQSLNRGNASVEGSYAAPPDFVNPYALIKPRPKILADAGIKTILDFPKPRDIEEVKSERVKSFEEGKKNRSEEKHAERAELKSKPELVDSTATAAVAVPVPVTAPTPETQAVAELKNVVAATAATELKAVSKSSQRADIKGAAISEFSGRPSVAHAGGANVGQVPEPATWAFALFGVLGASLLRRRRR